MASTQTLFSVRTNASPGWPQWVPAQFRNRDEESPPRTTLLSRSIPHFLHPTLVYNIPETHTGEGNPFMPWVPSCVGRGLTNLRSKGSIRNVIIYTGHRFKREYSPYASSISRMSEMFKELNVFRRNRKLSDWNIIPLDGEELSEVLKGMELVSTLLVIPAGESSKLDKAFSQNEKIFLLSLFHQGLRGYFVCGSGFWVSNRTWTAPCESKPEASSSNPLTKPSELPIFDGEAIGPLCPLPKASYGLGFYSTAIKVKYGNKECTVFLGGGGSLIPKHVSVKPAILSQLDKPSELSVKKAKLEKHLHKRGSTFYHLPLNEMSSLRKSSDSISSPSNFPKRVESLPELNQFQEDPNISTCVSDFFSTRRVGSLMELDKLVEKIEGVFSQKLKESPPENFRVLVTYDFEELKALGVKQGKKPEEMTNLKNAVVLVRTSAGAVVISMFHPEYQVMNPEKYEKEFPNSGTNWHEMLAKLSPLSARVDLFFFMMSALENFDFTGRKDPQ